MRGWIRSCARLTPAVLVLVSLVAPAGARGRGHDAVNFTRDTYRGRETSPASVEVVRGTHGCPGEEVCPGQVELETFSGGSADAGTDYQAGTQTLVFQNAIDADEATIPIVNDSAVEDPETVNLRLRNPSRGMVLGFPNEAVYTIIDNDGQARSSFVISNYEIFENRGQIVVHIVRSGPLTSPTTVQWSTQNGSAQAGTDFQASSGNSQFATDQYQDLITIPLVNDNVSESDETFSVTLSGASSGSISNPSSTTITIHDEDRSQTVDVTPPYTAFHQPLHKEKYDARDMRTLIAFMQDDENGTGMKRVDLAIRMKRDDGTCRWWNGTSFRQRSCTRKRWSQTGRGTETRVEYFSDTAIFELGKSLKSSNRASDIKYYTAYCRGHDVAGNIQREMITGQNRNNFDIRR